MAEKTPPPPSSSSNRRKARAARGQLPLLDLVYENTKVQEKSLECRKEGPWSSSPSASSNKSPLQMVTPVQPTKSVDSPPQMVASVQLSKYDSLGTSCANVSVGSNSGAAPFDICGDSKCSVNVKPSLLEINREKRRAKERSNSVAQLQHLRPGMVLLKNFLKPDDQIEIINLCREVGVGKGGFYTPGYRDGAKLSLRMMCLGKDWNPDSSSYGDVRAFDGAEPPEIPEKFKELVQGAIGASHEFLKGRKGTSNPSVELPPMSPDICIVNFYTSRGRLGLHQDKDESQDSLTKGLPVVSFSLGDTAEFLYGDSRDDTKASKVDLETGDVLIFGGESRRIFHGVSQIKPKTAPKWLTDKSNLQPGRLNLTFRKY
ncbi:hypothetical protein BRADI_1g04030v3 [Brachypodium distachyon]|uniref:Fe2OG dioxygenase domain-containing protein n=1 Tax=Brachypodium distachyon TaxID=15368 RepID=A0A2K2DI08_BRADI|nr:hypothetical protein BRADI_1g04030v3 [Brachypodium distachyon]